MKTHAQVKGRGPGRVTAQQAVFELKHKVVIALNKLADRDTYQIGVEELEKMAECLSPDGIAPFLSCILDTDSEQKSAVRKECIRLMGTLVRYHEGPVGMHLGVRVMGVFVVLVRPLFEALGEQNRQVQSAVIELNRSIIQAGGAPTQTFSPAQWQASCIRSLESCRFDKVKPVRDTVLLALQCWKVFQDLTLLNLRKLDLLLKKISSVVTTVISLVPVNLEGRITHSGKLFLPRLRVGFLFPKSHNASLPEYHNEESEGSTITKTLERMSTDVTSTQDMGYEYVHMDEKQECSSRSNLVTDDIETKFVTVSCNSLEECSLQKPKTTLGDRKQAVKLDGSLQAFTSGVMSSLSMLHKTRVVGLEHVVDRLSQNLVHREETFQFSNLQTHEAKPKTGPVLECLSLKTASDVLSTLASYLLEQRFINTIIPWLQQIADLSTTHGPNYFGLSAKARQEFLSSVQEAVNMEFANSSERRLVTQLAVKFQHIWGKATSNILLS
ncbi:hypothetical protein M0R45_018687 [Rubus argutus]|uniref:TOG domain-containing protein n=1 Tax=Rubus argutus TaxID=59490 RepID=A0AAW1X3A9_RUBAR